MNFLRQTLTLPKLFATEAVSAFRQTIRTKTKLIGEDEGMEGLYYRHTHPIKPKPQKMNLLHGQCMAKGIVIRNIVRKPKKPNSANRKCVQVRFWWGDVKYAYVPGEGHNLQEHNAVLVRIGRLRDTPYVHLKCIRGALDLPHVIKKKR